jgi:hypothetical protein
VKIISVAQNLTTADELKFCVSARGKRNKGHNLKNMPCVRLSMKMISIGRKVRTTEEQHLEQSLFRRGDYRDKRHNHERSALRLSSSNDVF